jgi:4-oxalmesaconate hydratase
MIVDSHAHLVTPQSLYALRTFIDVSGSAHNHNYVVKDEELAPHAASNIAIMDSVGTDIQMLSPRPFILMHSHKNRNAIQRWVRANNDTIAHTVAMYPNRFRGVAGLPQVAGQPIQVVFDEIDRCIDELGFVGVLLNPDPGEGNGQTPVLGDEYWYPLWEKLVAKDIPVHIHSAGCYGRENYSEHFISEESLAVTSVANSNVFSDFPDLKLMISHGGGSVPYQIGRWEAERFGIGSKGEPTIYSNPDGKFHPKEPFAVTLRRFYFDTVIHNPLSLELLIKTVGSERVLFGTEKPGSGSSVIPNSGGKMYDDIKPVIEGMDFLSENEKAAILGDNAYSFFSRLEVEAASTKH